MSTRDLILAIDLGTTACKAACVDTSAGVLSSGSSTYPTLVPHPDWAEQDPEQVWQGMLLAAQRALGAGSFDRSRIAAICFSAAMHGLLLLDGAGLPLTRCLTWADRRAQSQVQRLRRECDAHAIYLRTGCSVQPLYWPAKWLWFSEQHPEIARATRRLADLRSFFLSRLTGCCAMDVSLASGTGLLDLRSQAWDAPLLEALGLTPERLPQLALPEKVVGTLSSHWAHELGLPGDVPVVVGGADGGCANLGAGAVGAAQAVTSLGTSGAVRAIVSQPVLDAQERTWCYALSRGRWFVGGAASNVGSVYTWLGAQLAIVEGAASSFEQLDAWASTVPAGSEGLVFLPLLFGERSLGWHANARGVLLGLSASHTRAHLARAAIEGVAMCLYSVLGVLEELLGTAREMRVTGGLARSPLWVSVLADVYGRSLAVPGVEEASALGAALIALKALGEIADYDQAPTLTRSTRVQQPDMAKHDLYMRLYAVHRQLYQDALKHWDTLARLSEQ